MKLERSKNAKRNGFWGIIASGVNTFLPFLCRTIMIHELGAEYVGLNSLFTSILSVLSITELGFGTAIVYNMYQPLADDDSSTISALLNYYRKIYLAIGFIIFFSGIIIIPFLPSLISGTIPSDINLTVLYLMFLINTCISYFLLSYRQSLLIVHQRNDIVTKVSIICTTIMTFLQMLVIIVFHNYYLYLLILILNTASNSLILAYISCKMFPQFKCEGILPTKIKKTIKSNVLGMLISKISGVSRNAFDSIIVSSFLGLTMVAIYNNYYYIITAVSAITMVIMNSISSGVGNSIALETKEKNLKDMKTINFWYMWISAWFFSCIFVLYQPFMEIWVGKEFLLNNGTMFLFALYFFILRIGDIQSVYFEACGLWFNARWYAVAESLTNIILNFLLGYYFGIAGIVLATILSLFIINFLGSSRILFKTYFKSTNFKYILSQSSYLIVGLLIGLISFKISLNIEVFNNIYMNFFLKVIFSAIFPNICLCICYFPFKKFRNNLTWLKKILF